MINKITFLLTLGLVCLGLSVAAQPIPAFQITPSKDVLEIGDTLEVEITVKDFTNVIGFNFSLHWDPDVLEYDSSIDTVFFQLPPSSLFGENNSSTGTLTFLWSRFPPIPTTLPDGTTVIRIVQFVAKQAGESIIWMDDNPTDDLVIVEPDMELDPILIPDTITVNGGISPPGFNCNSGSGFVAAMESDSAATGEVLCLTTFVCDWTEVVNAQWSVNWNPAILQFDSIININPAVPLLTPNDFNANNNAGFGILAYADTTDTAGGTTIPDTSLFDVCFTVIGAGGEMDTVTISGSPLPIEVTTVSSMGSPIPVTTEDGFVTVSGNSASATTILASNEVSMAGELSCVPVTVQNFTDIVAFQYTMFFDTSRLVYNSVQDFNPNVNGLEGAINDASNFTDEGKILTAWSAFPVVPVTLANSDTLYNVCFDVKPTAIAGESAFVQFIDDPVARGANQDDGSGDTPITLLTSDGMIDIVGDGEFEMTIGDYEVCPDSSICIPVVVNDGFDVIISFQWIHTYETSLLTFDGVEDVHPNFVDFGFSAIGFNEPSPGNIRTLWSDSNPMLVGKTVPAGDTLYSLCFTATSTPGTSVIPFTDDLPDFPKEVAQFDGPIPTLFNDGSIEVTTDACPMMAGPIMVTETITHVDCNGNSTGAIDLAVTGGDGMNYNFIWDPGMEITQNIGSLAAGTYTVTITSGVQTFTDSYTVMEPMELTGMATPTDVSCDGGTDGAITLTIDGGTPNYSVVWNNTATTQNIMDLPAGTYIPTITDMNLCELILDPITITAPDAITAVMDSTDNVSCLDGMDGAVYITASGGVGGFTYLWSDMSTDEDLTGVEAGSYSVTITDTNMCTESFGPFDVTEPASQTSLSATMITQTSCGDPTSGGIDITPTGGTPGYTYLWNNNAATQDLVNIPGGTYFVTITDMNLCENVFGPMVVGSNANIDIMNTSVDPDCDAAANGSINITVTGGVGPTYTYLWDGPGVTGDMTQNLSNLVTGTYIVTVTDQASCDQISMPIVLNAAVDIDIFEDQITAAGCGGATNGAIDITVSGSSGYTFAWSDGTTMTQNISGIAAGDYTVTVSDSEGCFDTATFTVGEEAGITVTDVITDATCNGATDGEIDITPSGGSGTYTDYTWSDGTTTTQDITGIAAGTYTVTIEDDAGCTTSDSFTVGAGAGISAGTPTTTDASCTGATDGTILVSPTGGSGMTTYTWSDGSLMGANPTNAAAGSYDVTVTDAQGCSDVASVVVGAGAGISIGTPVVDDADCNGAADGSILVSPTGGSNYIYTWTGGLSGNNPTGVAAGSYDLTVTDDQGCSEETTVVVGEPDALSITETINDVNCNGDSDGAISIDVDGGTPNYNYVWSNTMVTQNIGGLPAGNYTVTVTDMNTCAITSSTFTVNQPDAIVINSTVENETVGGDGEIHLMVTGGITNYTYNWDIVPNPGNTPDVTGLNSGFYNVTVTDANLCEQTASFVINPANVPSPVVQSVTPVTCFGGNDGEILIMVDGGTGPYTYSWNIVPDPGSTPNPTGLAVGSYSVTVSDTNGAMGSFQGIPVTGPANAISYILDVANEPSCNGDADGSIEITISGGNDASYTVAWDNGAGNMEDPTGLTAGMYTPTITDALGCTFIGTTIDLTEPEVLDVTLESSTDPSCAGNTDGEIHIDVTGGTAPYGYEWEKDGSPLTFNSPDITGLAPGIYCVTVTDVRGCSDILCPIELDGADAIIITIDSVHQVTCAGINDGAIFITATGGQPPYGYEWLNGAGLIISNAEDLTGLIGGNYTPIVTDANGCTATLSSPIQIVEPAQLEVTYTIEAVSQAGGDGEISLMVTGGTPGMPNDYTYDWSSSNGFMLMGGTNPNLTGLNSGSYDVTITDGNGCSITESDILLEGDIAIQATTSNPSCAGSNDGQILITPINAAGLVEYTWTTTDGSGLVDGAPNQLSLTAGTYCLMIEDSNGSIATDCWTLVDPNPIVVISVDITNETGNGCNGSINITVEGGTGNFTYLWSNGETSQDIFDVCKGSYSVTIKDDNNCILVAGEYIVTAGPLVTGTINQTNVTCNDGTDGSLSIDVFGGCPEYSFDLGGGISPINSISGEATFNNLAAGAYALTITDIAGSTPIIYNFTITQPEPIVITLDQLNNNTDPNDCNGSINISVTGGNGGPYGYQWSNGDDSQDIINLCQGNYEVVVTDVEGCTAMLQGLVIELGLTASLSSTNVSCMDEQDGSIDLSVNGGLNPFTYTWSNQATTEDISGLEPGTYTVTITDGNMNTLEQSVSISGPNTALSVSGTVTQPIGSNANGSIQLQATGGWLGYSYSWTGPNGPIAGNELIVGLPSGSYAVIVTDANGCEESTTFVLIGGELLVNITTTGAGGCIGDLGTAEVNTMGGTGTYTYEWSNGSNAIAIGALSSGSYSVTVTDSNGLTGTDTDEVASIDDMAVELVVDDVNGSIETIVTGGVPEYTYVWNNPTNDTSPDITNQSSGDYAVVITDVNGCTAVGQATITAGTCEKVRRVITPNGDNRNDKFIVACAQRFDIHLEIYNRWGQLVYVAENYDNSWEGLDQSGKPLPESGYFYLLQFVNSEGVEEQIKGSLTLLR